MSVRWLGVTVSGDKAVLVDATVPVEAGEIVINADFNVKLQKGQRAEAYSVFSQEIYDYAKENGIERAAVKGSAVSQQGRPTLAHFEAAELRGVAIGALASVCPTETITKATISRNYGDRKADEYIGDDTFWQEKFTGSALRAGSREAAFCILAKCEK